MIKTTIGNTNEPYLISFLAISFTFNIYLLSFLPVAIPTLIVIPSPKPCIKDSYILASIL